LSLILNNFFFRFHKWSISCSLGAHTSTSMVRHNFARLKCKWIVEVPRLRVAGSAVCSLIGCTHNTHPPHTHRTPAHRRASTAADFTRSRVLQVLFFASAPPTWSEFIYEQKLLICQSLPPASIICIIVSKSMITMH